MPETTADTLARETALSYLFASGLTPNRYAVAYSDYLDRELARVAETMGEVQLAGGTATKDALAYTIWRGMLGQVRARLHIAAEMFDLAQPPAVTLEVDHEHPHGQHLMVSVLIRGPKTPSEASDEHGEFIDRCIRDIPNLDGEWIVTNYHVDDWK